MLICISNYFKKYKLIKATSEYIGRLKGIRNNVQTRKEVYQIVSYHYKHVTCLDMKTVRGESFTEEVVAYILDLISKIAR